MSDVTVRFVLDDQVSGPAKRIVKTLRDLTVEANNANVAAKNHAISLSDLANKIRQVGGVSDKLNRLTQPTFGYAKTTKQSTIGNDPVKVSPIVDVLGNQKSGIEASAKSTAESTAKAVADMILKDFYSSVQKAVSEKSNISADKATRQGGEFEIKRTRQGVVPEVKRTRLDSIPIKTQVQQISNNDPFRSYTTSAANASKSISNLGGVISSITGITLTAMTVGTVISSIGNAIASVIQQAVQLGKALVSAFAEGALSAGMFREQTMVGLSVMLKSKEKANEVYESAVAMAVKTPFQTQEVISAYKDLLGYGFQVAELQRTFTALGDMAAVKGDPSMIKRMALIMGQIRGKGRLQGQEMLQLAEAGLSQKGIYEALGKRLGKSTNEIIKLQEQGKISSDVAIDTILKVIEEQFGGTGEELAKTLPGLLSTLVSRPSELFDKALDLGGPLKSAYEQIKNTVEFMTNFFDPGTTTGKRVISIINQIGSSFADVFGLVKKEDLPVIFDKVASAVEAVVKVLGKFVVGLISGFKKGMEAYGGMTDKMMSTNTIDAIAESAAKFGKIVGELSVHLVVLTALLGAAVPYMLVTTDLLNIVANSATVVKDAIVGIIKYTDSIGLTVPLMYALAAVLIIFTVVLGAAAVAVLAVVVVLLVLTAVFMGIPVLITGVIAALGFGLVMAIYSAVSAIAEFLDSIGVLKPILYMLAAAAIIVVAPFAIMAIAIIAVVTILGLLSAAFMAIPIAVSAFVAALIGGAVYAIYAVVNAISNAYDSAIDFVGQYAKVGAEIVSNIVDGITSSAGRIGDALIAAVRGGLYSAVSIIPGFGCDTGSNAKSVLPAPNPINGYGTGGSSFAASMPTPAVRNPEIPITASASSGSGNRSFVLNISGAGLTPDELMARARAEFTRMLDEAMP